MLEFMTALYEYTFFVIGAASAFMAFRGFGDAN